MSKQSRIEDAELSGLIVNRADPRTLQIDIDTPGDLDHFQRALAILQVKFGCALTERRTTSKGGNMHIYVDLPYALSVVERILLQCCLGSDRLRELLSYWKVQNAEPDPIVLFELPQAQLTSPAIAGLLDGEVAA